MRLEELRASALELRIEAELALGRHATQIAAVADGLAAASDGEAVAVSLVRAGGDLAGTSMLLRVKAPSARVTAFTTDDPAGDTIRLAAEQDAAIRCSPPPPRHAAPPSAHTRFTWSAGS